MKIRKALGALAALGLVLGASAAFGQLITGTILGTVTDDQGGVLPGATVTISSGTVARRAADGDLGRLRAFPVPESAAE